MNKTIYSELKIFFERSKSHLASLIFFGVLLSGCYYQSDVREVAKPEDLIEKQEMSQIMADMCLSDAWLEHNKFQFDTLVLRASAHYDIIYQNHNVSKDQFMSSLAYYQKLPDELNLIYEMILQRLSLEESKQLEVIEQ